MSQKNAKGMCPRCVKGKLVTDNESGEMFCSKCGFVMNEKIQESGPEWRSFTQDEHGDRARRSSNVTYNARYGSCNNNQSKNKDVLGRHFESGGLYKFDIELLTANTFSKDLDPTIKYNIGISIPERTRWDVDDPNFGKEYIDVITYYDVISNFMYNPESKTILFSMPFDWNVDVIKEISVVHEEFSFSKSFGDLLVAGYTVKINGKTMPEMTATIDDFFRRR